MSKKDKTEEEIIIEESVAEACAELPATCDNFDMDDKACLKHAVEVARGVLLRRRRTRELN